MLTPDDMLVIRRSLITEIEAFERRLDEDDANGRPSHISITEYLRKLRGALSRAK